MKKNSKSPEGAPRGPLLISGRGVGWRELVGFAGIGVALAIRRGGTVNSKPVLSGRFWRALATVVFALADYWCVGGPRQAREYESRQAVRRNAVRNWEGIILYVHCDGTRMGQRAQRRSGKATVTGRVSSTARSRKPPE